MGRVPGRHALTQEAGERRSVNSRCRASGFPPLLRHRPGAGGPRRDVRSWIASGVLPGRRTCKPEDEPLAPLGDALYTTGRSRARCPSATFTDPTSSYPHACVSLFCPHPHSGASPWSLGISAEHAAHNQLSHCRLASTGRRPRRHGVYSAPGGPNSVPRRVAQRRSRRRNGSSFAGEGGERL